MFDVNRFDTALGLFLSTLIGAGVLALPSFANRLGIYAFPLLFLGFAFSVMLGFAVSDLGMRDIGLEIETLLGKRAKELFKAVNGIIAVLAMSAYAIGLKMHLGINFFLLAFVLCLPLIFDKKLPKNFNSYFMIFTVLFLGFVSVANLSDATIAKSSITALPAGLFLLIAYFAFFGHESLPKARILVPNRQEIYRLVIYGCGIAFLAYTAFTLTTAPLGQTDLSTLNLVKLHSGIIGLLISLFTIVLLFSSFLIFGLRVRELFGGTPLSSLIILVLVSALYIVDQFYQIPFSILVALIGVFVSIYALIVSLARIRLRAMDPVFDIMPYITIVLALLPFFLLALNFL